MWLETKTKELKGFFYRISNLPKFYRFIVTTAIILTTIYGFITRIVISFIPINFDIDQVRDITILTNIYSGIIPDYGPLVAIGTGNAFFLPPHYYYLLFPFTFISRNPHIIFILSGVVSFLTIYLFGYFLYRLFDGVKFEKRILVSSIGMFWWATLAIDIVNSSFAWNPSFIPFFFFLFLIFTEKTFIEHSSKKYIWCLYGIVTFILFNLHIITFFLVPLVFVINLIYFIYKNKSKKNIYIYPILTLITLFILIIPYFLIDYQNEWINSKSVIFTILGNIEKSGGSIIEKLLISILEYFSLIHQNYFYIGSRLFDIFIVFITVFGLIKFRGNKKLLYQYLLCILIFFIIRSSYTLEINRPRYRIFIWSLPIIVTLSCINSIKITDLKSKVILFGLAGIITLSIISNMILTYNYLSRFIGSSRLLNINDYSRILNISEEKTVICYIDDDFIDKQVPLGYLDGNIAHKKHEFSADCNNSDYFIYQKNIAVKNGIYLTKKNTAEKPKGEVIESNWAFDLIKF